MFENMVGLWNGANMELLRTVLEVNLICSRKWVETVRYPAANGFYYEMAMERTVAETDWKSLETLAGKAIKENQQFERWHNKYKVHIIDDKIPDGTSTTVYRCGPLIDLYYGPHIPDAGGIKAWAITKLRHPDAPHFKTFPDITPRLFLAVCSSELHIVLPRRRRKLQRVYGISFPDKKLMDEHMEFLEQAKNSDHRRIGQDTTNSSLTFLRAFIFESEYRKRGFHEALSSDMYNTKLWEISGHLTNYK
ncbi:Threonyl/alanyl tRNA synthetase, partial [Blyttiomyces helicus]